MSLVLKYFKLPLITFLLLQSSIDIDNISAIIEESLYREKYAMAENKSVASLLAGVLNQQYDTALLEQVSVAFLQLFAVTLSEFTNYLQTSLPSVGVFRREKLWAFVSCNCSEKSIPHHTVKKCSSYDDTFLASVQSPNLEIMASSNHDSRVLTHLLICVSRVYEGRWVTKTTGISRKLHKLANKMTHFISQEVVTLSDSTSDSEAEKENGFASSVSP